MKRRDKKKVILISGIYVLLLVILFVGMTLGRYQNTKLAYTSFGVANFNTVILGENTLEDLLSETPDVKKFGVELQTSNYRPGMIWSMDPEVNTAEEFDFCVANGINQENSSQATVEYSIRLRTLRNLPLKYTLTIWLESSLEEGGGHYVRYATEEPIEYEKKGSTELWYEYRFFSEETVLQGQDDLTGEALFDLQGGSLNLNAHSLLVEWPVEDKKVDNSPRFMKEVETMEIVVTTSSKNMLDTEEYVEDISNNEASTKSTGVLILDPSVGVKVPNGQKVTFLYTIDYRSFYLDAEEYSFVFEIENGISKGKKQTATKIEYDMLFKVPCNEDTKPYTYKIYDSLMEGASGIELSNPEYRIYNEIEGTYEVVTSPVFPSGKASPAYGIYAVYKVKVKEELINQINNPDGGGVMSYNDGKAYKLSILKETEEFSGKELAELAFNNKIELLVEATFMDVK